ncbi:MAG: hypothetical protein V1827_04460 [Candidatus Micrarchaeota archaeon]
MSLIDGKGPRKPLVVKPIAPKIVAAKPAQPPARRPVAMMMATSATGPKSEGISKGKAADVSEDAKTTVFGKPPVEGTAAPATPAAPEAIGAKASPSPVPKAEQAAKTSESSDSAAGQVEAPPQADKTATGGAAKEPSTILRDSLVRDAAKADDAATQASPPPAPAAPAQAPPNTAQAPETAPSRASTKRSVYVDEPGKVVPMGSDFWLEFVSMVGNSTLKCNISRRDSTLQSVELTLGKPASVRMNTSEGVIEVKLTYEKVTDQGSKEIACEVFGATTYAERMSQSTRQTLSKLQRVLRFIPEMAMGAFAAAAVIYASSVGWVREKPLNVAIFVGSAILLAVVAIWSGRERKKDLDS